MTDSEKRIIRKILIPEKQKAQKPLASGKKLRVAAYCRVSTKSEEQHLSYETQVTVYTDKIRENPEWEFAGIYADRGVSGTLANRRPMFLKMVADCERGKIDIVLCKSISRFARNTMDAVKYIRKLKSLGVRLIFEKERIDTAGETSEMLLTVLAAFAQEESHSHSENVKWGKRRRLEKGHELLMPVYGYRKNETGDNYEIVPEEAEIVKRIFNLYEHGVTVPKIVDALLADQVPPPAYDLTGTMKWDESRIHYMIQNEKYIGDLMCQKFFTKEFYSHRSYRNDQGEVPSRYLIEHHDPIISRKQFDRCNRILKLKKKVNRIGFYPFGDYLRCPYCGHVLFQRRLPIQCCDTHFCCEGDGACREFAIVAIPVKQAVLAAYNELDLQVVQEIAAGNHKQQAKEAEKLLAAKAEYPTFASIEYWWLEEFVERITFGPHHMTASDLLEVPLEKLCEADDRTVCIRFRCGIEITLPSGVLRDSHDPRHKGQLWDGFLLRHPERYPELTRQVRTKQGIFDDMT